MSCKIFDFKPDLSGNGCFSSEAVRQTAENIAAVLRQPGAVALLPTETVYGLTGRASDPGSRERIVQLKHRDPAKHIGWFVCDIRQIEERGFILNSAAQALAQRFMPGPLTLIAGDAEGRTVGFRIPDHPLLAALLEIIDEPLWQTSANRSGTPDALSCSDALAMLDGSPDAAADGGAIPADAQGSTIVDCTRETPVILRQGALQLDHFLSELQNRS